MLKLILDPSRETEKGGPQSELNKCWKYSKHLELVNDGSTDDFEQHKDLENSQRLDLKAFSCFRVDM